MPKIMDSYPAKSGAPQRGIKHPSTKIPVVNTGIFGTEIKGTPKDENCAAVMAQEHEAMTAKGVGAPVTI